MTTGLIIFIVILFLSILFVVWFGWFYKPKDFSVRPVLDRILILQDKGENTIAGFDIPDSEKKKPHKGTVVAVGWGYRNNEGVVTPLTVKVGDKVVYSEYAITTVDVDGVDYVCIKEGELLLIE